MSTPRAKRPTALVMSPEAAKSIAREFFLAGFRCSGYRAHGEIRAVATSSAFERLLLAEFERAWGARALADAATNNQK